MNSLWRNKMLKIFWVLFALVPASVFASIISHAEVDLNDPNYILTMNNQLYAEEYQNIMFLAQTGELVKAKQGLALLLTQNPYDINALDISGNILLVENKLTEAINAYQRVLSSKQSPEVMAKLGVAYLLLGNTDQARLWLTQSLSLFPENSLALRYLAWLEAQSLNKSAQLHYLSQLVKLNKHNRSLYEYHLVYLTLLVESNQIIGGLNFIENNIDKFPTSNTDVVYSIKLLEIELLLKANKMTLAKEKFKAFHLLELDSDIKVNYLLLSVFYYAHIKDYTNAKLIISEQFLEGDIEKSMAEYTLAKVYFAHGNYEETHNTLNMLLKKEPFIFKKVNYINDIIANYSIQSRYSDAIKFLKLQIAENPDVAQFQHQLSELYILSGRIKAAHNQMDDVIKNFPEYTPSYIVKARQLIKQQDKKLTIDFFNFALENKPEVAELWIDFSTFYVTNNQNEQAILTLEKALTLNKDNPLLTFELATMYDRQNMLLKSEPLYINILKLYPEYLPALDNLATNYFILHKDLTNAGVLAKRAFILAPDDPFIINLRAQAYIFENESQQAIDILTPVIGQFENSGVGYLSLAKAYNALKNSALAKDNLTKALENVLPPALKKEALNIQAAF
tara:strand:+ start:1935 stop:3800 length:1866 start_codon:yes stop_codon:yes gene_type:complete